MDYNSVVSTVVGAGTSAGVLGLLGIMWKSRVPMRKLEVDAEAKLRADLMAQLNLKDNEYGIRVAALEKKVEDMRSSYESKLEMERVQHQSEMALVRHRMNNLDQCLTMFLALVEENPEKAASIAARVRGMREKQEKLEADERARLVQTKVMAAAVGGVTVGT